MTVSVVTALFNEEDSVYQLVDALIRLVAISRDQAQFQFVFVNDGSRDETVARLSAMLDRLPAARLISHEVNLGFGAALRTGIQHAEGEIIVCYDADCTYPVEDILKLVEKVKEGYDVASANPFFSSAVIGDVPLWRQVLTRGNAAAYKFALGRGAKSITLFSCAFRAYKREVIQSISFTSNGFGAASEILGRLILKKYNVVEIPSSLSTRQFGQSKMNVRKAMQEHLRNVSLFLKVKYLKY